MKALLLFVSLAFQLGPATDVPNLVRNLRDPDPQVRLNAAHALGNYGPVAKDAVPALIECLSDDAMVETAAWSLGEIGPEARDAAPKLIVLARPLERRQQTVLAAIEALGKIGSTTDSVLPTLADLASHKKDDDPMIVHAARLALVALGPPGKKLAAERAIANLSYKGPAQDIAVREEAAEILFKTGEFAADFVPELIDAMQDKSAVVRQLVAQTFGAIGPAAREAVGVLSGSLQGGDMNVRVAAAEALGNIQQEDDVAIPAIAAALQDPSEDMRSSAAEALGKFGTAAAEKAPALLLAMKDNSATVRAAAAKSLAQVAVRKTVETNLQQALSDPDARVRHAAAEALGMEQAPEPDNLEEDVQPMVADFPTLMQTLNGGGLSTSSAAKSAAAGLIKFCRYADPNEGHSDPGPWQRKCADTEFVPPLEALRSSDTLVRRVASEAMAALGAKAKDAVGALVEALGDRDETVRDNVQEALSYLGPAAAPAVPALMRSLREQPDSYYAYAALQAIGAAARPAVPLLVSIFSDKRAEREIREWAGVALMSIDPAGDETQAAFQAALQDPLRSIQTLAAQGVKKPK